MVIVGNRPPSPNSCISCCFNNVGDSVVVSIMQCAMSLNGCKRARSAVMLLLNRSVMDKGCRRRVTLNRRSSISLLHSKNKTVVVISARCWSALIFCTVSGACMSRVRLSMPIARFLPPSNAAKACSSKEIGRLSIASNPKSSRIFRVEECPAPESPVTITSRVCAILVQPYKRVRG